MIDSADSGVAAVRRWRTMLPLVATGLVPAAMMFYQVIIDWVPIPFWDEWSTPGAFFVSWSEGHVTVAELLSQHNESRKLFPRLIYLLLVQFGGWDVRKEMMVTFATVVAITIVYGRIIRRLPGATTTSALLMWSIASFLCFNGSQIDNFLWGIQFEPFLVGLAVLVAIVVNTSRLTLPSKAALNACLAIVATYTIANGILLWGLGFPVTDRRETAARKFYSYAGFVCCGLIAVGCYFYGYARPAAHPPMLGGEAALILGIPHYIVLWIGSYYCQSGQLGALAVGGLMAMIFLAAFAAVAAVIIRTRNWRPFYPALVVAIYACATAALTAAGRIGFGVQQALEMRYRTFSMFFYLATAALIFSLYCADIRNRTRMTRGAFVSVCALMLGLAFVGWIECYRKGADYGREVHKRNVTLLRALQWIDAVPDDPDFQYLYPFREVLAERTHVLRHRHVLRTPFAPERLTKQARHLPRPDPNATFGTFTGCSFDSNHNLFVHGWALIPTRQSRADCILIGCADAAGNFKLVSILETGAGYGDVLFKSRGAGFARTIDPANFPAGDITVAGWAVDLAGEAIYPLGGATHLLASQR